MYLTGLNFSWNYVKINIFHSKQKWTFLLFKKITRYLSWFQQATCSVLPFFFSCQWNFCLHNWYPYETPMIYVYVLWVSAIVDVKIFQLNCVYKCDKERNNVTLNWQALLFAKKNISIHKDSLFSRQHLKQ